MQARERWLGLALGGGGSKGSAHIGVLQALETLGVPIDAIAGTSIGGLVAALYGVGYRPVEIEQWFLRARARRIMERDPSGRGFLGMRRIAALLHEALGARTFADARLPLAMVAVDLRSAREVVIREGLLVEAVLATIAVPGIFPPLLRGEQLLVDGGVLNNVPVDVVRGLGAERVIAVDLGAIAPWFELSRPRPGHGAWSPRHWLPRAPLAVAERSLAIMMARMSELRLAQTAPDVVLRPAVTTLLPYDFTRTIEGRMLGERAVFEQRAAIEALKAWRVGDERCADTQSG
ncbi:patatin-like phospholipase family protein [Kallotenue papyrolyticum]|uniref:patatin-like phospholipase family protein n=1 Tax=Kallotenue papyrolyticum TaxID=1325125 RepID=UPI0004926FFA|nr:patatin-like phospholipase family protein [Kallotenue papyrolyticum]